MSVLVPFVTVIHIILCVFIVLVVLIQQGKGAEISASFGGSSQTVFGSSGGANFFTMFTGVCAALFMSTSIFLATQGGSRNLNKSLMDGVAVPASNTRLHRQRMRRRAQFKRAREPLLREFRR
jgi:preprotein translocase subunit SecG